MSKYIDRSKVNDEIVRVLEHTDCKGEYIDRVLRAIESIPTIDIVNCIECEYLGDDWWCYKHEFTPIPIEDYFCKDGEVEE